ncbi:MAG: IS3 family transposase [Rhodobacteraceae bacterium]|nr:IS3 family transposase [Paracoccaceae bacterium]
MARASRLNGPGDHSKAQNAAMKVFFKTIKADLIWRHSWQTRRAVTVAIFEYINGFNIRRPRHAAPGWKSPSAFAPKLA